MNNPDLSIKRAGTLQEKQSCADIMAGSDPWITLGIALDQVLETIKDPWNETYVVRLDGEIVGTFILQTRGAFSVYLKSIAIKPELRGRNFGKIIMSYIERMVFPENANLFLCVSSFNTGALKFYEKLGYQKIGVLKDYLVRGYDEILMRKASGSLLGNKESMIK